MRRAVAAAVAAAAVAAVSATAADAKVVTVTDDTQADFAQGTPTDTVVRPDGAVELARTLEEQFDGTALPATWTSTLWGVDGGATVAAGTLIVDGTRVDTGVPAGPGSSVEFTADLGAEPFRHVGFATDFGTQPWAIFSTGGGALTTGLYARTSDGTGPLANSETPVAPVPPAEQPATYRIEWTDTGFVYFVNGVLVATHPIVLTEAMPVGASDFNAGAGGVSIDSIALNTHKTPGTFTSRKFDVGDAGVTGLSLTATGTTPTGTAITYETRTADTVDDLDAAPWVAHDAGGTVADPARWVQYRATLTTNAAAATARLEKVDVAFTIDDEAPTVTIQDVAVSGATAEVTFSSDDPSADVECSLDGAAFASCTSPAEFGGLAAGSHTIEVRSTDAFDNVGSATRTFDVASPPPPGGSGGGTPPPSGGGVITPTPMVTAVDRSAPKVLVIGRSARVSGRGVATLRVRCPRSEQSCEVAAKLKLGGKTVARKRLEVSGGSTQSFRLQLSKAARRALAARSRLKVTAVVAAADSAGNRKTTTRRMTLRAPAG